MKIVLRLSIRAVAFATRLVILAEEHLAEGILVPIRLWFHAQRWLDVETGVGGLEASLLDKGRAIHTFWAGAAAERYSSASSAQARASAAVADVAGKVRISLIGLAAAAAAAYTTALGAIAMFVVALAAYLPTAPTPAGPEAAAAAVAKAAKAIQVIVGAITALIGLAAAAGQLFTEFVAAARRGRGMPDNHWPPALAGGYSDGTVTDGTNVWSVTPS